MTQPDWQTLVLAHLTGQDPDHIEPDDLTNPTGGDTPTPP